MKSLEAITNDHFLYASVWRSTVFEPTKAVLGGTSTFDPLIQEMSPIGPVLPWHDVQRRV